MSAKNVGILHYIFLQNPAKSWHNKKPQKFHRNKIIGRTNVLFQFVYSIHYYTSSISGMLEQICPKLAENDRLTAEYQDKLLREFCNLVQNLCKNQRKRTQTWTKSILINFFRKSRLGLTFVFFSARLVAD